MPAEDFESLWCESITEDVEVAKKKTHQRRKTLGIQDTPPQYPSPRMDTPPTPSRPSDGAGHGHRAIPTVPIVSNNYVIQDAPLRESDLSTDSIRVRQRSGVMGKYRRSKSAPRLRRRASERLLLRQRMERGDDSMNETEKEDESSSCSVDSTNNSTGASHRNNHDSQHQSSNSNTQGILSDYIALKLELAELQSQFQHAQCDARSRIEDLQSQNTLLQRENMALTESNRELQEENKRLNQSRWFGRSRTRAAVRDSGSVGGSGQYYRPSSVSGKSASPIQEENLQQDDVSDRNRLLYHAQKKDTQPAVSAATTIRVPQKNQDANNIANDRELYKQIRRQSSASLKKDDLSPVSGDHEEENSIANDDELSKQIRQRRKKRMEESTQLEKESSNRVKSQQRHSNTSTSETSSDTCMSEQQRVVLTATEDTKSHMGDELCFSIQTESVSSDYLGYSVVQT